MFYLYLLVINIISFCIIGFDKLQAIHHRYRIPEFNFFILSVLGGFPLMVAGMILFNHKTKKKSFKYKVVAGFIISLALIYASTQ